MSRPKRVKKSCKNTLKENRRKKNKEKKKEPQVASQAVLL